MAETNQTLGAPPPPPPEPDELVVPDELLELEDDELLELEDDDELLELEEDELLLELEEELDELLELAELPVYSSAPMS
jgi:hypothetical protein